MLVIVFLHMAVCNIETANYFKIAARHWLHSADGWVVPEDAILNLGYSPADNHEQCRLKRRIHRRQSANETFNILISGGSVTAGHILCPHDRAWPLLLKTFLEDNRISLNQQPDVSVPPSSLRFAVDISCTGGYSTTGLAKNLDSLKIPYLEQSVSIQTIQTKYDLVILDHSVNDFQDFTKYDHHSYTIDRGRVNQTYNLVISQLRALANAPGILVNQYAGLATIRGYKANDDLPKLSECRDIHDFAAPTRDSCWRNSTYLALPGHNSKQYAQCHYIPDEMHGQWCYNPTPSSHWYSEDATAPPIAARGVPSMSMRNILWRTLAEPPVQMFKLWNGCGHPDGYAHNNMFGLTMYSFSAMFADAGLAACDLTAPPPPPVLYHICPAGKVVERYYSNPHQPSRNFKPAVETQWEYYADRPGKWGWIAAPDTIVFHLPNASTILLEFMKSYTPEWSTVDVWFNDRSSETITLDSHWTKRASVSQVVAIHTANTTNAPIPFVSGTRTLPTETVLWQIHIKPTNPNTKFKLIGMTTCS
jgi:hypothetical protein